jgi:hypothetical protein
MRQLWKLVKSVQDFESREKKSTRPFAPTYMDVFIAHDVPQLYSHDELIQIQHLASIYDKVSGNMVTNDDKKMAIDDKKKRKGKFVV